MYKPGYKTSEFWFTLVTFIFSGLYLVGVINDISQKEELIGNVSHAVESCVLIGGQLMILWKYINSRKEVKKSWWETQKPTDIKLDIVEVPSNVDQQTSNSGKSNKKRSRSTSTKNKTRTRRSKKSSDS